MARTDPRPAYGSCRRIRHDGYVDIWAPGHPIARSDGYIFEHRKMMWDAGLLTDPGLQVHHKNENKTDNRLGNFEVKSCPQHSLDHVEERGWVVNQYGTWVVKPRVKRANAPKTIRFCIHCGDQVPMILNRQAIYCGANCRVAAWRHARRK